MVKTMQKNINIVAEIKNLLTEYASEAKMCINGYDYLIVTGRVINKNLDIDFSYDNMSHNAKIRVIYITRKI